jgi:hypothetical protein
LIALVPGCRVQALTCYHNLCRNFVYVRDGMQLWGINKNELCIVCVVTAIIQVFSCTT